MTRTLVHSFNPPAASPVAGPTVDLEAANDASFLAERNDPAAGTVGPGELIRAHRIGDAVARGLRLVGSHGPIVLLQATLLRVIQRRHFLDHRRA